MHCLLLLSPFRVTPQDDLLSRFGSEGIREPKPSESIYDPTCGSAGMLLSAVAHLKRQNKEWRNLRLFGQERNLLTSAIGRMNLFLHGIEDFRIVRVLARI